MLLLAPFEESSMMKDLSDLPLERIPLESLSVSAFREIADTALLKVQVSGSAVLEF